MSTPESPATPSTTDTFPRDRQPTVRILAMPAHANPNGNIFGGWIMAQMDVAGSVVAVEYAGGRVATVAVTSMEYHTPVYDADLLSCSRGFRRSARPRSRSRWRCSCSAPVMANCCPIRSPRR